MGRISIFLEDEDFAALQELARLEYRHTKGQACMLIKEGLIRRGMRPPTPSARRDDDITPDDDDDDADDGAPS